VGCGSWFQSDIIQGKRKILVILWLSQWWINAVLLTIDLLYFPHLILKLYVHHWF
jgi:hypothetical protein